MVKNKLALYIFIALIAGIIAGYVYNVTVIEQYNNKMAATETSITALDNRIVELKDTTTAEYKTLKTLRVAQVKVRKDIDATRESKLKPFTLLNKYFLWLIKMIVAPLVFTTLVVGLAKVGSGGAVGRIGVKTMLWFISATLVSLLLGMLLVNFYQPGAHMHIPLPDSHSASVVQKSALSVETFLDHVFTESFFQSMVSNSILQIVVFALFFGVATAAIGEQGKVVIKAMDAFAHVIMKMTGYVMNLAPLAVFGSITAIVAKQGLGILTVYAAFISEFYSGLIILWLVIITAGFIVLKRRVFTLVNNIKDAILIAFSTSTSEAAYPRVLIELEKFGCKDKIVSFVLPLGYSFNLDGSMMYMTFASLFIAQAYNIPLSFGQQLTMLLILMLTSKGIAGVPRASLVVIAGTLSTFNIPEAGIALLLGIDPLLDMGRSATNVLGNAMATAVVSKWEGELGPMTEGLND